MTEDRLSALYRTYGPVIFSRCARLLGDRTAAEDATQETFLRVQRHLEKAPDSREALLWIYRIATNYCLNELRDRKQRPELDDSVEPHIEGTRSIDEILVDRDLVARIVQRSPEKVRTVAWLHHVDGLDQGEVARVAGCSRRTVLNRLDEFADNARKFIARSES